MPVTKKFYSNPLLWIQEGFFYGDTLQRAVNLLNLGVYDFDEFRIALDTGLCEEIDKYTRWSRQDNPSWEANKSDARRALDSLRKKGIFSYKGVQVDLGRF